MRKTENELIDNINSYLYGKSEIIDGHDSSAIDWANIVDIVEKIFDYIRQNARLCKLLLSDKGDLQFQKKIMMLVYSISIENIIKQGKIERKDAEYIHSFGITGCVGCIQKWFDNDMDISSRAMAEMIVRFFYSIVDGFRGRKPL